jgi:hypothetical protein
LFFNDFISSRRFSIVTSSSTNTKSFIYFRGTPFDVFNDSKYQAKCSIISNDTHWGSYLDSITAYIQKKLSYNKINLYSHQKKPYSFDGLMIIFTTKERYISVPHFIFQQIKEKIFKDKLNRHQCEINNGEGIICAIHVVTSFLKEIRFKIEGDDYFLDGNELFEYYGQMAEFIIQRNQNENDLNVIIGICFLKKFHITFDYENEIVVFYSKHSGIQINLYKRERRKVLKSKKICKNIFILLLIGSLFLLYIKFTSQE